MVEHMKCIDKLLIDGQFVTPNGTQWQDLYNPALATSIGRVRLGDQTDVNRAVQAAKKAFASFSLSSLDERAAILERIYQAVANQEQVLTQAAIEEYGSPITATKARTRLAAQVFREAKEAMQQIPFQQVVGQATIIQEPLGVVAAITPWNADYVHICAKLAPAIAAGCTTVIKPSEFSALQTQQLAECFVAANIPPGLINIVNGTGPVIGAALVNHPDVAVVSFTGSTQTGRFISQTAAEHMKRVILELGGKSPNILLEDADFDQAIPLALQIAFSNSGQACHAGSRLLVPQSRWEETNQRLIQAVAAHKVGHLWEADSTIGPMVNQAQFDRVQYYIHQGIKEGATLLAGGLGNPDGLGGWYVKPTIFTGVSPTMRIAQEEIFGPVLSVIAYQDEAEAVRIANDTIYGLSAYVSSANVERARNVAAQLISGRVLINKAVNPEAKTPFGGFKQSGIGRTGWVYGIQGYLEPKVIA